jgi:hypothetical protein
MLANKLLGAAKATTVAANYIEDSFSTYLYTGNGSTQTITNNIYLGGVVSSSMYFAGTDTVSTTMPTIGTGNFTAEFWFYPTNATRAYMLLDKSFRNTNFSLVTDYLNSGVFYLQVGGTSITASFTPPIVNQWNHVAISRSSGTVRFFLNGVQLTSASATGDVTSGTLYLGSGSSSGSGYQFMLGWMSNVRFTNTAVYTSNFTVPTTELTAISGTQLLTFTGTNASIDYSTNAYTITVSGATPSTTVTPFTDPNAKGGLVWIKGRSGATDHALYDTARGATFDLVSNSTAAQTTQSTGLTAFNSNGFSLGALAKLNTNAATYASWTFRKQAKFFDVVTYTGNGTARTIAHNLGSTPGCVIVKRTDSTSDWSVYHRGLTSASQNIYLNLTNAAATASSIWNSTAPTSTVFSVGTATAVNANGGTYVAYLFAHDAGGFGAAGTDNVITCGTYLGSNHRAKEIVTLGYEPQWVMVKNISSAGNSWVMTDIMRNMSVDTAAPQRWLLANSSAVESTATTDQVVAASTGFYFNSVQSDINEAGSTFIYIAIRRPMKPPTSGTSVFSPVTFSFDSFTTAGFPVDFLLSKQITSTNTWRALDRLRGSPPPSLSTSAAAAEVAEGYWKLDNSTGVNNVVGSSISGYENWMFRRSSGFFDVVCDTGTGSAHTITHGLTVAPELMIRKKRNSATNSDWAVWHTLFSGTTKYLFLNTNGAEATASTVWTSTSPTSTVFSVGTSATVNNTSDTFVTYLFATVAGVSKVGSYTGTGTTQTINCGFTAGARFVMIKRTDSTGDWYVWDTARGIVSGNDSYLRLNSDAAQDTTTDYIDPANSGFEISSTAPAAINANGGTFIFLAIA